MGCAWGWSGAMGLIPGYITQNYDFMESEKTGNTIANPQVAKRVFNLSRNDFFQLFVNCFQYVDMQNITPKMIADRLRKFIETHKFIN